MPLRVDSSPGLAPEGQAAQSLRRIGVLHALALVWLLAPMVVLAGGDEESPATREATTSRPDAPPSSKDAPASGSNVPAADDWGNEGADTLGFGAGKDTGTKAPEPPPAEPSPAADAPSFEASGFLRSDWGAWVERLPTAPLAKARQSVDLAVRYRSGPWRAVVSGHVAYDPVYLLFPGQEDAATRETYEWLADLRESYVQGTFGALDVTFGRQIVAWGEGDIISPLDVVNPRDLREPGLADLDDLRLPALATRAGLFLGDHRFELMIIHAPDFGYRSPPLGPFSPLGAVIRSVAGQAPSLAALLDTAPARFRDLPAQPAFNNQQYLARWVFRGPAVDVAAYAASVLDRQGVITEVDLETDVTGNLLMPGPPVQTQTVALVQQHARYWLLGHSGALPLGSWLLKWEVFGNFGRQFTAGTLQLPGVELHGEPVNLAGVMAGVTSTAVSNLRLDLEVTKAWLLSDATNLLFAADEPSAALRAAYSLPSQHLSFEAMTMVLGWLGSQGWLARASVTYNLLDGLAMSLGGIHYGPGPALGPLAGFDTHDRINFKVRYDFKL